MATTGATRNANRQALPSDSSAAMEGLFFRPLSGEGGVRIFFLYAYRRVATLGHGGNTGLLAG